MHYRNQSSNLSQQQDANRPPPGAAAPPNDMQGSQGGPLTPLQQGGSSDPNINAPKFSGKQLNNNISILGHYKKNYIKTRCNDYVGNSVFLNKRFCHLYVIF